MTSLRVGTALVLLGTIGLGAQNTPQALLSREYFEAIRGESSGELPAVEFRTIQARFSGFAPSRGGDGIAEHLAARMRQFGLSDVAVEGFPADGQRFFWAFLTEPSWEAESGTLEMVQPRAERLVDFSVHQVVLGRFSTDADVVADLVDVGAGVSASDYEGKDVKGRIVLATGEPGAAHAQAVWERGAAGVVWHRTADAAEFPHLLSNPAIVPWSGKKGERPGFSFAVSFAVATELHARLARGERVVLRARVKAQSGPGEYRQVSAAIRGKDPSLPEVWVYAHDNHRNSGGANNLTGVGATVEIARVLQTLIARGTLPAPLRTIRFWWGAEHYAVVYGFHAHPERKGRALAMLNVDMTGFHQERSKAVFRLYRQPNSQPHFLSDLAEDFMHVVGKANQMSIRNADVISTRPGPGFYDVTFAPTGSRDQLHYLIEDFSGPSDHEDVVDASLGVPAVLYNDWPDPFLGTQEDDIDLLDPTQMRRSVMTVAATAYYLATASAGDVPRLAALVTSYAQARMAREFGRATALVSATTALPADYREATNLLADSNRRETAVLQSLAAMGASADATAAVARGVRQVKAQHDANAAALQELATTMAAARQTSLSPPAAPPEEAAIAALVPKRTENIKGPVHFFRPEYGLAWLRRQSGDDNFRSKIALASRGHYVLFEALNFADGKRSLQQIRDAVSAEYGPVNLRDLEQYFRFLAQVGVVSIGGAPASSGGER